MMLKHHLGGGLFGILKSIWRYIFDAWGRWYSCIPYWYRPTWALKRLAISI